MDMKEEMMNDAIDDAMEDEGDEEERYFPAKFPCFIHTQTWNLPLPTHVG